MRLEKQEPASGAVLESTWNSEDNANSQTTKQFLSKSTTLPFGQAIPFSNLSGPTYVTAQTLIQQVAYSLSEKLYSYSPETFDLDLSAKEWAASNTKNVYGTVTSVSAMQTRAGAGAIALGYMFSKDFDLKKRYIPQALLGSAASLQHLRGTLDQLSLLYSVANPFVAHVTAVDYSSGLSGGLVTDYISALTLAEELGLGLVASASAYEAQHMALFATALAGVLPTLHVYDGVSVGRETVRVIDVLDQSGLKGIFDTLSKELSGLKKNMLVEDKAEALLKTFNNELGTDYKLFEFHGHASPETVLVVFGTVEASLASQVAVKLSNEGEKVGVLNVRVYRPFSEDAFLAELPSSVTTIAVLGQVADESSVKDEAIHSALYADVLAAVAFSDNWSTAPTVVDSKYAREETLTPTSIAAIFRGLSSQSFDADERVQLVNATQAKQYTFWDLDDSSAASAPATLAKLLSGESANNVFLKQTFDNSVQGGATRTDIRSSKKSIEASYPIEEADVTVVGDVLLLRNIDILKNVKVGGKVLLKLPGVKDEDLEKKLSDVVRRDIILKKIELSIIDSGLSGLVEKDETVESILLQLAFLKIARPELLSSLDKLAVLNGSKPSLEDASADLEKTLRNVEIPQSWAEIDQQAEKSTLPSTLNSTSFTTFDKSEIEQPTLLSNWQSAAKALAFKEAYGTRSTLRPDLTVKTHTVTVSENRRLTPLSYDRNIFHIEFAIGSSGLTYNIGEALGIHAENPLPDVQEFIKSYNLDPAALVSVPSREDPNVLETRTVLQSLLQNIDLFGRPPARFYESLAAFATDDAEKKTLLTLAGPEGATEFKRRAEVDTITYADILEDFPSARPSFEELVKIVAPLKRREYSIASAQAVTPNSVALMIVVVNWVDPRGRTRYGNASRYLSLLAPGAKVAVSVKPSVMKLPALASAPLILAGLGTGLAPFRAFVSYRAMQKAQGENIGPIHLYLGSRHQREEYLYGEEWEAWLAAGVITVLGRAFSRDQPQKIYIQDRMRETMGPLVEHFWEGEGSFYLCGPTWPVGDVGEVMAECVVRGIGKGGKLAEGKGKKVDGRREIEVLKEAGRYVLEVY